MGVQLVNVRLRRSRRRGGVLPTGHVLPELDPTQPTKMVPCQTGANNKPQESSEGTKRGAMATPKGPCGLELASTGPLA